MFHVPDDGLEVAITSKYPAAHPPTPPFRLAVALEADDPAFWKDTQINAGHLADGLLGHAMTQWRDSSAAYARCQKLTAALAEIETKLAEVGQGVTEAERESRQAFEDGHIGTEADSRAECLRTQQTHLERRQGELLALAGEAKDRAENELRTVMHAAQARCRIELTEKIKGIVAELDGKAGALLRALAVNRLAFERIIRPQLSEQIIGQTLETAVKPDGLTVQRKQVAAWKKAEARQQAREAARQAEAVA